MNEARIFIERIELQRFFFIEELSHFVKIRLMLLVTVFPHLEDP